MVIGDDDNGDHYIYYNYGELGVAAPVCISSNGDDYDDDAN